MVENSASAGHRRYWIVISCIVLANAAFWVIVDHQRSKRASGTLHVESFEPGDGEVITGRPTFKWHFNQDVFPTSNFGRDAGSTTPEVPGRWGWDTPRTLTFIPDADLPTARLIKFTLSSTFLRGINGATLAKPYVATVDSTPLEVADVRQVASQAMDRYIIELRFNDRVNPQDVLQHLTATTPKGLPVRCELYGQAADRTVRVQTDSLPRSGNEITNKLDLSISTGLGGLGGPLGLMQVYSTEIDLDHGIMATELNAESPAREKPYLNLVFNNGVDLSKLREVISIQPGVPFTLTSDASDVRIDGDFKATTRYTVILAPAPAGEDAAKYPLPGHLSAFVPDCTSGVWFDNEQGYLSSAGNRTLVAHSVNLPDVNVTVSRVYDNNLLAWRNNNAQESWDSTTDFGLTLAERKVHLSSEKNVQQDIRISLDDWLPASAPRDGVYRVEVRPVDRKEGRERREEGELFPAAAIATLSDIGLTAKQTNGGIVVWAVSLRTAAPLPNVRVRVFSNKSQLLGDAVTATDGIARISDINPHQDESAAVILADRAPEPASLILGPPLPTTAPAQPAASDLTWLDIRRNGWELGDSRTSGRAYLRKGYEAYIYTDRGVYRPGETVHLRAIVRGADNFAPTSAFPVKWQIRRPDLHDWRAQSTMLDADGAASFDLELPQDLTTGQWTAAIGLPGDQQFGSATFQVEEFMPSRMKVGLKFSDSDGHDLAANARGTAQILTANTQADYLFGRPAEGLPVTLSARLDSIRFTPSGWEHYSFGDTANAVSDDSLTSAHATIKESAKLDGSGHNEWSIDPASTLGISEELQQTQYMGPWKLSVSSGVSEAGGRTITAAHEIQVDLLKAYIGVRRSSQSPTTTPGQPCELLVNMVRPDGSPYSETISNIEAKLLRESWNTTLLWKDGRYYYDSTRVLDPIARSTLNLSGGIGTWSPMIADSGSYVVWLRDTKTGALTTMPIEASNGSPWDDNISRDNPEHLNVRVLSADEKPEEALKSEDATNDSEAPFRIGETANVLIESPFPGRLLLSTETDDVVRTQVLDMPGTHLVVPVPINEACRPNAFISATVIRPIDPNAKWNAHRAFGVANLRIDPTDRTLNISLTAPSQLRPLQSLDVGVAVTNSAGQPVANSAVCIAAVDEGICQITHFSTPDPLSYFTADRALGVQSSDIYDLLMPEISRIDSASAFGGDRAPNLARHSTPVVARRVKPVALAWEEVHTDASGLARTSFPIPEFEGSLRVMAVAYHQSAFGSSDKNVTVRSPIVVQSSWPRFAAPGDQFTVPLVLFNNTAALANAKISIEQLDSGTLLEFASGKSARTTLPAIAISAGGQHQVDLPVSVSSAVGVAKVRLHMTAGDDSFSEDVELPIRPPAPMTQFGGYALASTTQPATIATPVVMLAGTGSLSIHVTPWPTLQLPQALDYLNRYPYGCVEQTTSEGFPLLALGDLGKQIDPQLFDANLIHHKIDNAIIELIGMQTTDGGLSMWPGGREDWIWGSIYAAHFLVEAKTAGYEVPEDFYSHLLTYVGHQLSVGTDDAEQLETQAYASYVLALAGKSDRAILNRLTELAAVRSDDAVDPCADRSDARLLLSCAWLLDGRSDLAEQLLPDSMPLPRTDRELTGNLGSGIRDRALLIYTLATVRPADPALPNLVQQLADSGQKGQWDSTQDNAFALMAIARYLHQAPKPAPYETAQLLMNDKLLTSADRGGSISWSASTLNSDYRVQVTGDASAGYVSWIQTGVPLTPPKDAEHGMKIARRYLTLDGKLLAGNAVQTGTLLKVELTIEAPAGESNIVIDDLLPAGLEIENPRLSNTAKGDDNADDSGKPAPMPDLTNARMDMRDDRLILMGTMPDGGVARHEYLVRAVTPGKYVIPSVRAELMYDIATNGISGAGGWLTVVPANANVASIQN